MLDIDPADVGELDIDVEAPARVVDLLDALRRSEFKPKTPARSAPGPNDG